MTEKERKEKLKDIKRALKRFPKIVKQDEERGKEYRKQMKAFEPMIKDLIRRIKNQKIK